MTDETPLYARHTETVDTETDGTVMLLQTEHWQYFLFNTTSSAIWAVLEQPAGLETIVDRLTQSFDVDRKQCLAETRVFLDDLIAQGVVTRE